MAITRRHLLRAVPVALGAWGLSGCGLLGEPAATPSPSLTSTTPTPELTPSPTTPRATCAVLFPIKELGISVSGCQAPEKRGADPAVYSTQFSANEPTLAFYLLPDDFTPDNREIMNGHHGYFRSIDQLPEGEPLDWTSPRRDLRVHYASQPYSEYTNSANHYRDAYAFVSFKRPPKPGHSVLTVVAWRCEDLAAAEKPLNELIKSIWLL